MQHTYIYASTCIIYNIYAYNKQTSVWVHHSGWKELAGERQGEIPQESPGMNRAIKRKA